MTEADVTELLGRLAALPGVRYALLVQTDGLLVAQQSATAETEPHHALVRTAAMTATALSLNKRIVGALGGGTLTETSITGTEGKISLYAAGSRVVLALVTEVDVDVQLMAQGVKEALEALATG